MGERESTICGGLKWNYLKTMNPFGFRNPPISSKTSQCHLKERVYNICCPSPNAAKKFSVAFTPMFYLTRDICIAQSPLMLRRVLMKQRS